MRRSLVVPAVLAALLTGCGGDGDADRAGDGGVATTTDERRSDVGEQDVRLPVGMEGLWERELPSEVGAVPAGRVELDVRADGTLGLRLADGRGPQVAVTEVAETALTVDETGGEGLCPDDTPPADYEVEVEGEAMTISDTGDACAERVGVLAGDWRRVE